MSQTGQFRIVIQGVGKHGCDRHSIAGEPLRTRCQRLSCIDCRTFDFVQTLRMLGFRLEEAEFTHHAGAVDPGVVVVDDMLTNTRASGQF